MRVLGQKSFSKLPMNAGKTDLKARCLAIARKTLCITFEIAIQWMPNKLPVIVNEPVSFKKDKYLELLLSTENSIIWKRLTLIAFEFLS